MRVIIILLACAVLLANAALVEEEWEQFKVNHRTQYRSHLEESARFHIFQDNLRKVTEHNKKFERGEVSYKLAINKFADLTEDEFKARLNPHPVAKAETKAITADVDDSDVPDEVDWRKKGAVTGVKDQGECGGCWAFGTTGTLEAFYFFKTGNMIPFSEQYLIDCSVGYNNGCRGGWTMNALRFIRDSGLVTEESYPYEAADLPCRANGTLLKDIGFAAIQQNEEALKAAVAKYGPVAVSIDASYLYLYASGVFDYPACSQTFVNHVVLIVGYGTTTNGLDYWLVKNSWGADWGEDGYVKMSRNKGGQCAITSDAFYPIL